MRYYEIRIITPSDNKTIQTFTSHPNGVYDPGAPDVEFDLNVTNLDTPVGRSYVRIWGLPLSQIARATDYNGMTIEIYGGMKKGLPLANPSQAGLLVRGTIAQAFGNWRDVTKTIDFYLLPEQGSHSAPANIVLNWQAGMPLATAITNALKVAFPSYTVKSNVKTNLVQAFTDTHYCSTLEELSNYVAAASQRIVSETSGSQGPNSYSGVHLVISNGNVIIDDGSTPQTPVPIAFTDLIGQPTWLGPAQCSVTMVLRGDLIIGDWIKMPDAVYASSPQAVLSPDVKLPTNLGVRNASSFQGVLGLYGGIRHLGHYRQMDGYSWVTVYDTRFVQQDNTISTSS